MSAVEKNDDTISDCTEQPITEMDVRDRIVLEKCRSKIIKDLANPLSTRLALTTVLAVQGF